MFLAMFPEYQSAVYEEQVSIFGDSTRGPESGDLAAMTFLSRVVKETLRHVSPPGLARVLTSDIPIGNSIKNQGGV